MTLVTDHKCCLYVEMKDVDLVTQSFLSSHVYVCEMKLKLTNTQFRYLFSQGLISDLLVKSTNSSLINCL